MINILDQSTDSCLAVRLSAKLSGTEYQLFIEALQKRLNTGDTGQPGHRIDWL